MGIVYEAYDRERGAMVALKTVRQPSSRAASRLKNEFRALADVEHRNLVSLYELVASGDQLFFTMELIGGVPLTEWVWKRDENGALETPNTATLTASGGMPSPAQSRVRERPALDLRRLRDVAKQLALGVHALHDAGLLHRDLKPSNILVSPEGRAVILDFGLVIELEEGPSSQDQLVGTASYMAPEQGARLPLTPACDWYSLGCVLYVALTGRPPYLGAARDVLVDKQRFHPPPPSEVADDVPDDLDALVVDLLQRDPLARPPAADILRRLGAGATRTHESTASVADTTALFGRDRELAEMRAALSRARGGEGVLLRLRGASGTGKSALLRHFVDSAADAGATVVGGRCYERESMPFKALDPLMEQLAAHLSELPPDELRELLPYDLELAARIFPALRKLDRRAKTGGPSRAVPFEQRRRAFMAVRRLLGNLARSRTLILYVDDLQWGDADSAPLLSEILQPPDAPPLLLILAYRTGADETNPLIRRIAARDGIDVELDVLADDHALALASSLLEASGLPASDADAIASEAAGHPFFIHELVRLAHEGPFQRSQGLTIDRVIAGRVARVPASARRFLETVAIAGRPIPIGVVAEAAQTTGAELPKAVNTLRATQLVRSSGIGSEHAVEPYHDRIGETLVDLIEPDVVRATHHALALALQKRDHPDAEALARHFYGAGDHTRAVAFTLEAAEAATAGLAFDRAAALYERALELGRFDRETQQELHERLGEALANAGFGEESANAFLAAAEGVPAERALALKRRAAEQNLYSGHVERGLALLGDVLSHTGFRLAATPRRALVRLALLRARLRLRGLRFRERAEHEIPPRALMRTDVCRATAMGLGMSDFVRASEFQTRALLLALKAGEPSRIARTLGLEIVISSCAGRSGQARNQRMLDRLDQLALTIDDPTVQAWRLAAHASFAFNLGGFEATLEYADESVEMLRERLAAVWEINSEQLFALWSLYYLGRWRELEERLRDATAEADQRGDLYSSANLRTGVFNALWLGRDRPERAHTELADAMRPWPDRYFHLQHYWEMTAHCQRALYVGDAAGAWTCVQEPWKQLKRSLHMRIAVVRAEAFHLRARAGIALAAAGGGDVGVAPLLRIARKDARRLDHEGTDWTTALAALVGASATELEDGTDAARPAFATAVEMLDQCKLRMFAAAARLRMDRDGHEGAVARAFMLGEGVADPENLARMLVP